jgi:hypothetical protein
VNTEDPSRVMTGRVMATWFGPSQSAERVATVTGRADPNNWIREKVQAILQEGTASLVGTARADGEIRTPDQPLTARVEDGAGIVLRTHPRRSLSQPPVRR